MSSISDTAKKIATRFIGSGENIKMRRARCAQAIEQVLRARDKRTVKIIEDHQAQDKCEDNCWTTIKAAIRKED